MLQKYGRSKISQIVHTPNELISVVQSNDAFGRVISRRLKKRMAAFDPIRLNPDNFLYIRNRSISAEEIWGPNQNFDAWPSDELDRGHPTFVNAVLDIDHDPSLPIGMVLDSFMLPRAVLSEQAVKEASDGALPVLTSFDGFASLQSGDQLIGDWVENVWAINKQELESFYPNAVEAILDGEITDTSMGAEIQYSSCNICKNKAAMPDEYCEHIGSWGVNKGTEWDHPVSGHKVCSYERCYGVTFFEDSLILPEKWNGSPGSEGADVSAKVLQVLASAGSDKGTSARFAGQLRLLASRMGADDRQAFVEILKRIK